jgi:hypothetical protein
MSNKLEQFEALVRSTFKESPSNRFEQFEAKLTSGFVETKSGKHVAFGGLTDRKGRRKVFPMQTDEEAWTAEINTNELMDIAETILHGRNATVFEGLVLRPLRGLPKRTVDDLAKQFGILPARIYRIKNDCVERVKKEIAKGKLEAQTQPTGYREANKIFEVCERCKREYPLSAHPRRRSVCRGNYDPPKDCLIDQREAWWQQRKADMRPRELKKLREDYRAKQRIRKERDLAERRAHGRRYIRDEEDRKAALGKKVWYYQKTNDGNTYYVLLPVDLRGDYCAIVKECGGTREGRVLGEREYKIHIGRGEISEWECSIEHAILRARREARAERREHDLTKDIERNYEQNKRCDKEGEI